MIDRLACNEGWILSYPPILPFIQPASGEYCSQPSEKNKERHFTSCFVISRVGRHSDVNKMSLNNLATIFGPNVLRPSPTGSPMDLAQGTLDVMSQVGIFLYFLKLDSDDVRLPNDPEIRNRLDPTMSTSAADYHDRLI